VCYPYEEVQQSCFEEFNSSVVIYIYIDVYAIVSFSVLWQVLTEQTIVAIFHISCGDHPLIVSSS
jgi:hypothetical protein